MCAPLTFDSSLCSLTTQTVEAEQRRLAALLPLLTDCLVFPLSSLVSQSNLNYSAQSLCFNTQISCELKIVEDPLKYCTLG